MNRTFVKSWKSSRGITLIEVIAGVTLLGTVLVAVVMTTGVLTSKSHLASRRVEAYRAADAILATWWSDIDNLPKNDSGTIEGHDNWQWRTSAVDAEIKGIDAELVTLEVVETDKDDLPLANIEFLLKRNDEKTDEQSETQPASEPTTRPDAG